MTPFVVSLWVLILGGKTFLNIYMIGLPLRDSNCNNVRQQKAVRAV